MQLSPLAFLLAFALLNAKLAAQTTEDFETFYVAPGSSWPTLVSSLDDTTVLPGPGGAGPGLVEDGCTYSCTTGYINWVGDGYYNLSTRELTVNFFSLLIDNNFYSNELTYGVTPLVGGALATLSIVSAFIPARMSG
ncbi:MAG: hypothetical protein GY902_11940, partial [Planctomycetes bacterium]|nr:hypothetical protein [Planctomycetota bacterium]